MSASTKLMSTVVTVSKDERNEGTPARVLCTEYTIYRTHVLSSLQSNLVLYFIIIT